MGLYYPGTANDNVDYYYTNSLVRAESEGVWGNPSDDSRSDTGWRFQNVTVPQGATIGSAKITWTSSRNSSGTVVGSIQAEDADNPATFTAGGAGGVIDFNTRLSNLTTASVSYSQGAVSANTTYDTPDIKTIVQEIVDRGSWSSGNSMVFFLLMGATSDGVVRFWRGYSYGSAYPVLEITILNTYTLTCDTGSFALTGNNINFKRGYVMECESGSVAPVLVDSYIESNRDAHNNVAGESYGISNEGQTFHNTLEGTLDSCKFSVSNISSATGDCYAELFAHSGTYGSTGVGTGTPLATSDVVDISTLPAYGTFALQEFTFSGANRITLEADTNYVITLTYPDGDGTDMLAVGCDESSPTHSGNRTRRYDTGGGIFGWDYSTSEDVIFYVYTLNDYGIFRLAGNDTTLRKGFGVICQTASFILTGIDTVLRYSGWSGRTKPSSSWSDRTKPGSTWTDRTKPTTNWLNR